MHAYLWSLGHDNCHSKPSRAGIDCIMSRDNVLVGASKHLVSSTWQDSWNDRPGIDQFIHPDDESSQNPCQIIMANVR